MNASDIGPSRAPGPPRGVGAVDVALTADALLRQGRRPTIERVREYLGRGSPNTINPLLDEWWKTLAARLSGGPESLERIPASAFHVLEALWVQLQMAARDRAAQELARERGEAVRGAESLEIRSQVLSLRESELNERLRRQEDRVRALEDQLQSASMTVRRAQADTAGARLRAQNLEAELAAATHKITAQLTRPVVRERASAKRNRKAKRKAPRTAHRKRTPPRNARARRRR